MGYIGAGLTRFNTADELTVTGDAQFDTSTLVIDSTNDRVGIGTSSPSAPLDVTSTSSTQLELKRSGSAGQIAALIFKDGGDAQNRISSTSSNLVFGTGSSHTERMRITSSGDMQVGTTQTFPAFNNVVGCEVGGFGQISASRDGAEAMQLNRKTSHGVIARFKKDGTDVGTIGSTSGAMHIANTAGEKFVFHNGVGGSFYPATDNNNDLGASSNRFKDLYLSGSVTTGGSVGINTSAPSYALTVDGAGFGDIYTGLITNSTTATDHYNVVRFTQGHTGHAVGLIGTGASATGNTAFRNTMVIGTQNATDFAVVANDSERLRVKSGGSVGIGTSSPDEKLHVSGAIRASSNATNWSASDGAVIDYYSGDARIVAARSGSNSSNMQFYTFSSGATGERMRVTSAGNVGIGTTSPAEKLQVNGIIKSGDENATGGQVALTGRYDDTHLPWTIGSSYSSAGVQIMYGLKPKTGVGAEDKFVSSASNASWTRGALQVKDSLKFFAAGAQSTAIGTEVSMNERFRVTGGGQFLIGQTAARYSSLMGLEVSGSRGITAVADGGAGYEPLVTWNPATSGTRSQIKFADSADGGIRGQITTNGTSTTYLTTSDHRLKENAVDLTGAISRVKNLQPKRFNFISDTTNTLVDGFMAHEAQTVVPEAVSGTHNEVDASGNAVMQGIDQSKLVPLLTGALQEAIAKIETLETEMTALKARVTTLENA